MPKVLISDNLSPKAAEIFRNRGIETDVKVGLSPEELAAIIGDYDGLAVRSATKLKGPVLEVATALKVVGCAGIGVDNIDVPGATARGVVTEEVPPPVEAIQSQDVIATGVAAHDVIQRLERVGNVVLHPA